MTRTLLTGASGRLGTELLPRLRESGHDVRPAARSPPTDDSEWCELDLTDGDSIRRAVDGVDVIVHAASAPQGETEAVDVHGTERLLDAAERAGVDHLLYVSIVGIEEIPYSYYQHKLAAERAIEESAVQSTVLRATQFHQFVRELLAAIARLPVWPLPTQFLVQPVDAAEVADAVVDHATVRTHGRLQPVGGPEVHTAGDLARAYRAARDVRRPVLRLPLPGKTAAAFRNGEATCPDRRVGDVTWEEYLDCAVGTSGTDGTVSNAQTT